MGLIKYFKAFEITYMPMEHNFKADLLSKLTSKKRAAQNNTVIQKTLFSPNIKENETHTLEVAQTIVWMTPIIRYQQLDELSLDKLEAKKIRKRLASTI